MSKKVIVTEKGSTHHLPVKPHFRDGTETICNRIDDADAQAMPLMTARQKGYSELCHHCQAQQNRLRRRGRRDTIPSPEEAVERIRRLRRGGDA